jgi:glucosamine kinase
MSHTCYHPGFEQADIRFVLGVDGGGTGTRVRVWTNGGALIGHGEAGPSALSQGIEQAWKHIGEAVARAFQSAGLPAPAPAHCVLGLGLAGAVAPHLAAAFFRGAPEYALIVLETDARTALLGAHAGRPGAIVAVGTGSVGEALHADGRRVAVSGWGFPVGDEGSGAWMGLRAMQVAHRALDGRGPAGPLAHAVWRRTSDRRDALLEWCSRAGQHDYAQLAPLVFECAETDAAAEALLRETAHEIEDMALALDPELQLPIVLLGSIGQRMAERLPAALRARLVEPAGDAVDGAHRLVRLQLKEAVA